MHEDGRQQADRGASGVGHSGNAGPTRQRRSGSGSGQTRPRLRFVAAATTVLALGVSSCATSEPAAEPSASPDASQVETTKASYAIVDTGQVKCYNETVEITCPAAGEAFFGQDGDYLGNSPSYTDNGNGTVTDNVSGLMWRQDPGDKTTYSEAVAGADAFSLAGHDDWRLPTIKELYSLILFSGVDASSNRGNDTSGLTPFIDTKYFAFEYGDTSAGQRVIDSQWTTSTTYKSIVFEREECFFGVNFADGRIKCYPTSDRGTYFTIYVRDSSDYGTNSYADKGDGTVTDKSTDLTWQQKDNGEGVDWKSALSYCDALDLGGSKDWRLPNAKELQSIVDYSKSPDTSDSAAIDSAFETSSITNEAGEKDFPAFWTSTTHVAYPDNASNAAYITFGRALGYMNGRWMDVHGAGAQRSDPKTGDASEFPTGHGPQGDAVRIDNYVRCVSGGTTLVD